MLELFVRTTALSGSARDHELREIDTNYARNNLKI